MVKSEYKQKREGKMKEKITAEGIRKGLSKNICIEVYDSLDSTNTLAKKRISEGCGEWHTVIALSQTGGEGRLGRSFFSPADTGLYMSCVLYPDAEKIGLITGTAAVAVCEALEGLGVSPSIKWVNDIFVEGKKVCGILAKSVFSEGRPCVILGIGLNVFAPEKGFPEEIKETAGYLFSEKKRGISEILATRIIEDLMRRYDAIGRDNAPSEYRKRCITIGQNVKVIPSGGGEIRDAFCTGILDNYHLTVRYNDGTKEELSSGEVSVKI